MNSRNHDARNVGLLAACQAMLFTNNSTLIAINGLVGFALAPYKGLATLPITCWVLGGAIATMPASLHMKRVGRQRGPFDDGRLIRVVSLQQHVAEHLQVLRGADTDRVRRWMAPVAHGVVGPRNFGGVPGEAGRIRLRAAG